MGVLTLLPPPPPPPPPPPLLIVIIIVVAVLLCVLGNTAARLTPLLNSAEDMTGKS